MICKTNTGIIGESYFSAEFILELFSKEYIFAKDLLRFFNLTLKAQRPNYLYLRLLHSRSKQRTDQRVLVLTLKFLALKNWVFPYKKYFIKFFWFFFLPLFYATFQYKRYNIFKIVLNSFFAHENMKKRPQKLLVFFSIANLCGPKLFQKIAHQATYV